MKNWRTKKLVDLMRIILSIKDEKTALSFFRDLCTIDELEEMSERWNIVQLLDKNESYRSISQKTGASTTTVARIAQWLERGEGGYQAALALLKKKK